MNDSRQTSLPGSGAPSQTGAAAALLRDADLCVKCGLCVPQCPTYVVSQNEADSPRGRIAIAQGLFNGMLEASTTLEAHLDGCLSCRRCEAVCPARVPYGRLLDATRAELVKGRPERTRITRLLGAVLTNPVLRSALRLLLGLYRSLGLQALVRRLGLLGSGHLARLESMLPPRVAIPRHSTRRRAAPDQGRIALFNGCASDVFERDAMHGAGQLLREVGFEVSSPRGQGCCGALHQHAGLLDKAGRLARSNMDAFADFERIATCTTGCAATLRDYADLTSGGAEMAARVADFSQWLEPFLERLQFRQTTARVALHTACTARNVLRSELSLRRLLERVPGIEIIPIGEEAHCCGAAGSHFITHPDASDRLLESRLEELSDIQPDLVLSANIGCSLHIAGGLRRRAQASGPSRSRASAWVCRVEHPASFLARLLVSSPPRP